MSIKCKLYCYADSNTESLEKPSRVRFSSYNLMAAYVGGPAAQSDWLGPKVGGHLAPFLYSSHEPSELSQWLCYDDSTINTIDVLI